MRPPRPPLPLLKPGEVRLLAGGNPQIAKGDGDGPVQAYIAAMPGWKRAVGERIDALMVEAVPDVVKAVRWNQPFYGSPRGWIASVHCFTAYVKLTFLYGADLDPPPPVPFKDPDARALHIRESEALDETQLRAWFAAAHAGRGWRP